MSTKEHDTNGLELSTLSAAAMALLSDQRTIAYRAPLARISGGSPGAGVLLAQLLFWSPYLADESGWFGRSAAELAAETGMSDEAIATAGKRLLAKGYIVRKVRGVPATTHYRINYRAIVEALAEDAKTNAALRARNVITGKRRAGRAGSDSGIPGNKNPGLSTNQIPAFPDSFIPKDEGQKESENGGAGAPAALTGEEPALKLYEAVTGRKAPAHLRARIVEAMPAGATVESLAPFYKRFLDSGAKVWALYWLTEWAQPGGDRGTRRPASPKPAAESAEATNARRLIAAAESIGETDTDAYRQAREVIARGSGDVLDVAAKG